MTKKPTASPGVTRSLAVKLKNAGKRTTAQQAWLSRQLNDPYVAAAQAQGWRSRAAFKLIELDDKFSLIKPHSRIVDLGAAPGGWSQVAVKRGALKVVGVDLLPIDPVQGAELLLGDFNDPAPARPPGRAAGRPRRSRAVGHGAQHHRPHRDGPSAHHRPGRAGAGFRHPRPRPRRQLRGQGVPGRLRKEHAGADEAVLSPPSATPSRPPAARAPASSTSWPRVSAGTRFRP